jgi:hypothetical protein
LICGPGLCGRFATGNARKQAEEQEDGCQMGGNSSKGGLDHDFLGGCLVDGILIRRGDREAGENRTLGFLSSAADARGHVTKSKARRRTKFMKLRQGQKRGDGSKENFAGCAVSAQQYSADDLHFQRAARMGAVSRKTAH